MNPFTALLYKEFRQQLSIWLALFVCALLMQGLFTLGAAMQPNPPQNRDRVMVLLGLAWVLVSVYAFGSAGSVFVSEHEEKTYGFLRGLPIRRRTLFAAKISWTILGTVSFAFFLAVETFSWIWCTIPVSYREFEEGFRAFSSIDGWYGVAIIFCNTILAAFVWGLFWSTRCRNQLFALLATFVSAAAVASLCKKYLDASDYELTTLLLVDAAVALSALFGAYFWFDRWIDRKNRSLRKSRGCRRTRRSPRMGGAGREVQASGGYVGVPTTPPALALMFQAIRQSGWLFTFMIAVGVFCLAARSCIHNDPASEWMGWISGFALFTTCVFCGSIFMADHRNNTIAMLGHRGVKPSTVWWSRIVPFGVVYFSFFIVYNLAFSPRGNIDLFIVPIFATPFCCGTLISLLFRSPILGPCLTALAWVAMTFWMMIFVAAADAYTREGTITTLYWSAFPLLIGFLIASRLRLGDWLRERSLWRSRRPVVCFMVGPALLLLAAIPFLRIYSVPNINLGFHVAPWELRRQSKSDHDLERKIREASKPITSIADLETIVDLFRTVRETRLERGAILQYDLTRFTVHHLEQTLQENRGNDTVAKHKDFVTLEFIDKAISLLESIGNNRPPLLDRIRDAYEIDYRSIENDEIPPGQSVNEINSYVRRCYRWMPWEKIRELKLLQNDFQIQSRFAELTEQAVFENKGDMTALIRDYSEEFVRKRRVAWVWFLLALGHDDGVAPPSIVFNVELNRRALILRFALLKYCFENNKLPKTLDELVSTGILKALPTQPNSGKPYKYLFDWPALESAQCTYPSGRVPTTGNHTSYVTFRTYRIEKFPKRSTAREP